MQVLSTDVVVVGGGAAGCYAALNLIARASGRLIVCKGLVGKSGASIFAGNLVLVGPRARQHRGAGPQHRRVSDQVSQPVPDRSALGARAAASGSRTSTTRSLRKPGLYLRRDDQGNVVTSPGKIRSVAANMQGNSGVPFMDLRRKQVIRAGIPRLEETAVTALLRRPDGSVCGVFALNVITGEYRVVLARAVILATGYSDRLHARSTGTREMSGDGIAMAWRVGRDARQSRNAMVAHQRHRRSADLAAHAGLSQPDARLGEVGAHGQFGGRGVFQPAAGRSARLRPLHRPAQGAGEAGARRQGALRRRLLRRASTIAIRARSRPIPATARASASSACAFPRTWSRPP